MFSIGDMALSNQIPVRHPMKTPAIILLTASLFIAGCQSAPANLNRASMADISVQFRKPDTFTDVRDSTGGRFSQSYLDLLAKHLQTTAANRLRRGQKLSVIFTDIDLAGDIQPGGTNDVRIVQSSHFPRMEVSFILTDEQSVVLKQGDRRLHDLDFQTTMLSLSERNSPLAYDKRLLTDWVAEEFAP